LLEFSLLLICYECNFDLLGLFAEACNNSV
jgi:hypothetical protein